MDATIPNDSVTDEPPWPGWWLATDGNWYPPQQHPDYVALPSRSDVVIGAAQSRPTAASVDEPTNSVIVHMDAFRPTMPPPSASALVSPAPSFLLTGNGAPVSAPTPATSRPDDASATRRHDVNTVNETTRALLRARAIDTAEAWRDAAQAAAVMAQMAQTMRVVSDAKETARQLARQAQEAEHRAQGAAEAASQATFSEMQAAQAAQEATQATRDVAKAATEARQNALRSAQAVTEVAQAAKRAARAAADAEHEACELERIVETMLSKASQAAD